MVNHYYVNIRPLPIPMSDGQWLYTHHCIATKATYYLLNVFVYIQLNYLWIMIKNYTCFNIQIYINYLKSIHI